VTHGRSRLASLPRRGGTVLRRLPDRVATAVVLVSLVGMNLTQHVLHFPWWVQPVQAAALLGFARLNGLTWPQLGLGRDRMASGCRWALGSTAVVVAVYTVAVLLPPTRAAFQDSRYDLPLGNALFTAFVAIPLGTVLPEEVAFRSVLWGMLQRHSRPWQVLATTSVLFGLWHILPSLHLGATNQGVATAVGGGGSLPVVAATVAFTALGGLVFGELRRRSGSVLAGAGAHWATNSLGVLFGLAVRHLAP
jgi:membrane protease YdiL (CAAX protease family)